MQRFRETKKKNKITPNIPCVLKHPSSKKEIESKAGKHQHDHSFTRLAEPEGGN